MPFDRRLVYELVARHVREDGLTAAIESDGLHVGDSGLLLRLRTDPENPPRDDVVAVFVWLDVLGIVDRDMFFDISGWGVTPEDQAIDLAHGIIESILPPLRWLVDGHDPGGRATRLDGADAWTVFIGQPWVVVAAPDGEPTDALAADIRGSMDADPGEIVRRLGHVLMPLTKVRVPHWIKVYVASNPAGPDGRIDVDNSASWPGVELAASFRWASPTAVQLVRQLLIIQPGSRDSGASGAERESLGSRARRFLRRSPSSGS